MLPVTKSAAFQLSRLPPEWMISSNQHPLFSFFFSCQRALFSSFGDQAKSCDAILVKGSKSKAASLVRSSGSLSRWSLVALRFGPGLSWVLRR